MITEILENLTTSQIWKLQDASKKSKYEVGSTVILFNCPENKSCFKKDKSNPRVLGSCWKVLEQYEDSVVAELIPDKESKSYTHSFKPRHTIHKKYIIDLSLWRDLQLEYLFK
jgi:hypothetical protein